MEWAVVWTLLLSGFLSLSCATTEKIFHFVPDKMDWPSAQSYCTDNFADLASISDSTDMALLSGLVETGDQYAFVGLKREWRWTVLDTEDQREAEIKFNMFEDGEPQDDLTCGMIKPSGEWTTDGCSQNHPFICYDESNPDRFVKGNGNLTFSDARIYCRQHHTDLAKIRNEVENQFLVSLCNGTQAWIGLKKTWTWSDGMFVGFAPWVQGNHNNHHCTALHITAEPLGITTWDCNSTLPFFCYSLARKKYTVRITLSAAESGVDLADSAADSVTKLVQSKLNDEGFSKDVRLTWHKHPQKVEPPVEPEELECPKEIHS